MFEEDEEEDYMDPLAAAKQLRELQQQYAVIRSEEDKARQQAQADREARFRAAEQRIRQSRFGEPSRADQMFALSAALLSPRRQRGIAGTLQNVIPTLGRMSAAKTAAEQEREQLLQQLQQQYAMQQEQERLGSFGTQREQLVDLMKIYGPLAKRPTNNQLFAVNANPQSGVYTYQNFDVPVAAVNALRYALQTPGATEEQKAATIAAFEAKYRVPANTFLQGMR